MSGSAASSTSSSAIYETGGRSVWASRPPGVEGWLPIASLMNLKVLLATGEMPRAAPGRHVPADRLPGHVLDLPQELLRLAVPGGDGLGVPVAPGTPDLRPQLPPSARARRRAAQPEVPAAGAVPVCRRLHVRPRHPRVSGRALRHRGRRQDAQLLPLSGARRAASWWRCWRSARSSCRTSGAAICARMAR